MLPMLFGVFLKIGAFTFGGGYAMIALLENEFVQNRVAEGKILYDRSMEN